MAIYGFRRPGGGIVSRAKGESAIAKAAYNARDKLENERTGETVDYTRAYGGEDLAFAGLYVPKDAPEWANDRAQLWNHAEAAEKRQDAQLARNFQIDLPHELTEEQNRYLVQDFVRENFTRKGFAVDVAIHRPGADSDSRNIHAHLLVAMRTLGADGFAPTKARDQNTKEQFEEWRENWAHQLSRHLRRHGFELEGERMAHGHLSQEEQREKALERGDLEYAELKAAPAQIHMGKHATALEREGIETDKGDHNRQIAEWHKAARDLRHEETRLAQMQVWQAEREEMAADLQTARARSQPERMEPTGRGDFADLGATHAAVSADREADKLAARAMIGEAWRGADDALHFAILLGDKGYSLAENDKGLFVAVDSRGASHYLTSEATGENAREVQSQLAAVFTTESGLSVPSVAEVRQRIREETDEPARTPRPDRRGEYHAIEPEALAQQQERAKERDEWRAAWYAEQRERMAGNDTVQAINAAWREAIDPRSASTFAAALEDRGIVLARVSDEEAARSRAEQIEAQLLNSQPFRALQSGDLRAVDKSGRAYELTPRIIEADEYTLAAHLAKLDFEPPTLTEARAQHDAERAQRREAWQAEQWQAQADRMAGLRDVRALREAYREAAEDPAPTPREQAAALVQAIEARGFLVARVTPEEAAQSNYNADNAEAAGHYRARLEVGDVLAVNQWGGAYRLDSVTLGDTEAGARLCSIDQAPLLTLTQAREAAAYFRENGQGAAWLGRENDAPGGEGGAGLGIVLGGVIEGVESFVGGIERFLFGGSSPRDESNRPPPTPEAPKAEGPRNREKLHRQDPTVRAADPETPRYHFGLDPELVAELRRQREQREREAEERGRDDR